MGECSQRDAGSLSFSLYNMKRGSQPEIFKEMIIKKIKFDEVSYYKSSCPKKQIVLHHTVSNPVNSQADADYWKSLPSHIACAYIQSLDGSFLQLFEDEFWGHHLGVTSASLKQQGFIDYSSRNVLLNQQSIAVEIDAWGGLFLGTGGIVKIGGKGVATTKGVFYNAYGSPIDSKLEVVNIPWRGFEYFQKYSDAQVESLGTLLQDIMRRYSIPSYGLKDGNFNVRRDALVSTPGIFSHSNYRSDKSDLYPDFRIISMLKNL